MTVLTLKALAALVADHDPTTRTSTRDVVYRYALSPAVARRCGRDALTVTARIESRKHRLMQVATLADDLPPDSLPLAVAAANTCNQSEGWPMCVVNFDVARNAFDLRFAARTSLAAGVTDTVRNEVTEFPAAAAHCLGRLHQAFHL